MWSTFLKKLKMAARRRRAAAAPPQTPDAKAPRSSSAGHLPRPYRPRLALLLPPLLAVRLYGALASPITDCDEAFNYWSPFALNQRARRRVRALTVLPLRCREPLHYLLYGRGLQTWEYSPVFGLRSYAYLAMHAAFARLASSVLRSKVSVFLAVRCALGCTSAVLEARLAARTCAWASGEAGVALWALLLSSAGMWHAAVALLPSSFAMLCVLAAWTAWMDASLPALPAGSPPADRSVRKAYGAAIFWVSAVPARPPLHGGRVAGSLLSPPLPPPLAAFAQVAAGCLLGWPFLCVLAAPLAIDAVVALGLRRFVARALLAGALLAAPSAAVDGYYYGRFVLPWLNLLLYNRSAASGEAREGERGAREEVAEAAHPVRRGSRPHRRWAVSPSPLALALSPSHHPHSPSRPLTQGSQLYGVEPWCFAAMQPRPTPSPPTRPRRPVPQALLPPQLVPQPQPRPPRAAPRAAPPPRRPPRAGCCRRAASPARPRGGAAERRLPLARILLRHTPQGGALPLPRVPPLPPCRRPSRQRGAPRRRRAARAVRPTARAAWQGGRAARRLASPLGLACGRSRRVGSPLGGARRRTRLLLRRAARGLLRGVLRGERGPLEPRRRLAAPCVQRQGVVSVRLAPSPPRRATSTRRREHATPRVGRPGTPRPSSSRLAPRPPSTARASTGCCRRHSQPHPPTDHAPSTLISTTATATSPPPTPARTAAT